MSHDQKPGRARLVDTDLAAGGDRRQGAGGVPALAAPAGTSPSPNPSAPRARRLLLTLFFLVAAVAGGVGAELLVPA